MFVSSAQAHPARVSTLFGFGDAPYPASYPRPAAGERRYSDPGFLLPFSRRH
jgi:hypothetical protein